MTHILLARLLRPAVLLGVMLPAVLPAAAQPGPASVYVVQPGDTLFRIARAHGLTVEQLKAYNGLTSNLISVGQELVVAPGQVGWSEEEPPAGLPEETTAEPPDPVGDEEVELLGEGDPLDTEPELISPDPIPAGPPPPAPPPSAITRVRIGAGTSGQVIAPPPSVTRSSGSSTVHVVQAGETLFTISRRYGTTVEALRALNGLEGNLISVGQELVVAGEGAPAPVPPPRTPYDWTESTVPDDRVHVTRRGETLYAVAARYGTSVEALLARNTLTTAPLPAGTVLALPDSAARYYRSPAPPPPTDETGLALVYPDSYRGRETISGDPYDPAALTASHRTLPFGTVLHVTMPATERSVLVRVNDRGPVSEGFLTELSEAAAAALGQERGAAERVELRVVR